MHHGNWRQPTCGLPGFCKACSDGLDDVSDLTLLRDRTQTGLGQRRDVMTHMRAQFRDYSDMTGSRHSDNVMRA